ncbi:MAG: hypothetical protein EBS77_06715 [Gammaproteobacteria bacterium]|nr:hypothetical protein [Gammaproteobacteria bacterium]
MPIRFAPAIMSLFGVALAWRTFAPLQILPYGIATALSICWIALGLLTLGSVLVHTLQPAVLRENLMNPQTRVLFPAVTVGVVLLGTLMAPYSLPLATGLVWAAAVIHLLYLAWLLQGWLAGGHPLESLSPVWFIPAVGNIVIPVGAVAIGAQTLGTVTFGIGLLLWLMLWPALMLRLITGKPMPHELEATQLILIAPPAIGSVSWAALNPEGSVALGLGLLGLAVFLTVTLMPLAGRILRRPFVPSNWAFGFPLAALATGLAIYGSRVEAVALVWLGFGVLVSVSLILVWALIGTSQLVLKT